ncbi:MAG: hypothetical protein R2828_34885 [Saprospiraceae bacterium]
MNLALIISFWVIVSFFVLMKSYRTRIFIENSEHIELELKGFKVNWFYLIILGINCFFIFAKNGFHELSFWSQFMVSFFFWLVFVELGNLFLQQKVKRDRLILKKGEILFFSDWKYKLQTDSIQEISLNGFTNKLKIKANNSITFSMGRLSEENLRKLIKYLEKEIGLSNLKISDNLIPLIKL